MSRVIVAANAFVQQKGVENRVSRLERVNSQLALKNVNTTGLTSAEIDTAVFSNGSTSSTNAQPSDGLTITDTVNKLVLVRQAGKWYKTGALTEIS